MEQKRVNLNEAAFSCSICLDLLDIPVTIPCGHSYCMVCIKGFWKGKENDSRSCPQCRETFTSAPALVKNTMLAALTEELQKTGICPPAAEHHYAGAEDVACDICTGKKLHAVKSCLTCLASYCEEHLQPHSDVAAFKKHKLVEPFKNLQETICSIHNEVMKLFCRTDQKCICYLCSVEEHKGHDTVSAAAERTERQRELEENQLQIQQRIQDREKEVKLLQQQEEATNMSVDQVVENSEKIFTDIICLIDKKKGEVKNKFRSQQQTKVGQVKGLQEELEQEITELKRRDAELKQLSLTEDHHQFLHSYSSLPPLSGESTHSSSIIVRPPGNLKDVTAAVLELRKKLEDILREELTRISLTITQVDVSPWEPKSRPDFLTYYRNLTLDPNTAHTRLMMLKKKKVIGVARTLPYPDNAGRFTFWWQVLSKESLTGRCYWEVEWKGDGLYVAVAYNSISRDGKGKECSFGWNENSWAVHIYGKTCIFYHNCEKVSISAPVSSRIGMYLDHTAGVLSFYSVSKGMTLLHRVQTTFTKPLHAGLWLSHIGDAAEFLNN
ncbi:tripartite motif-containing protein 16 [Oryzias latipes]|uniref:tripartite motif-containing protein 16 n=1 Tax=Oryzias latipes TaxID=8090 RepID=UPI000CE245A5|nr:tripartite motif-containing protein 16 [Oryzias latipes]